MILFQSICSQQFEFKNKRNYLKNNDSKSFVFLSKNYLYKINHKAKLIDSIYFELENNFDNFQLLKNKNYYLINSLGGQVYTSFNRKFNRIDNSFSHKSQILSSLFIYNSILYRFGGYGYFDSRNFITFFSEETMEWEVLKTNSKVFPPGLYNNKFFIHMDALYVFGGYTLDNNNREKPINNKEFWKFSFKNQNWTKIGSSPLFSDTQQNSFDFYDNGKFYFENNGLLNIIDVNKNNISQFEKIKILDKTDFRSPAFKLNDTIYFIGDTPNSENTKSLIYNIPIKNLVPNTVVNIQKSYTNLLPIIFLILCLIFLFKMKNIFKRELKIKNNKMSYGFKNIRLLEIEMKFFYKLINQSKVSNNELLEFINSNIDISQKTRIKNETINSLNIKLEIISSGNYIINKVSSDQDKRYFFYTLTENN